MNKKYIWGGVFLLVVIVGLWFGVSYLDLGKNEKTDGVEEYRLEREGISFEYKTEPDGYVVEDLSSFIGEEPEGIEVISVYRLMNAREKAELEASEGGREGPPTINLTVFKNVQNQSAKQWVDTFPLFSNLNFIIGEIDQEAVVAGVDAIRYLTDGLYQNQNVVIAHDDYIYYFVGSFLEKDSAIYRDFNILIDSVTFIPNEMANTKIDIRLVCESALAYMTFSDGKAAEAFVESCINGEHPEVIERYISDLGLDGASI